MLKLDRKNSHFFFFNMVSHFNWLDIYEDIFCTVDLSPSRNDLAP